MFAGSPKCQFRPRVQGGGYLDNYAKEYKSGASVKLECEPGYEASEETESTCTDEKWTVDPLVCKPGKWLVTKATIKNVGNI